MNLDEQWKDIDISEFSEEDFSNDKSVKPQKLAYVEFKQDLIRYPVSGTVLENYDQKQIKEIFLRQYKRFLDENIDNLDIVIKEQ